MIYKMNQITRVNIAIKDAAKLYWKMTNLKRRLDRMELICQKYHTFVVTKCIVEASLELAIFTRSKRQKMNLTRLTTKESIVF